MWLMQNGMANPNNAGAGGYPYMHLMGIVALGLMWLLMAKAAPRRSPTAPRTRRSTRPSWSPRAIYAERILPDAGALRRKIEAGAEA